MSGAKIVKATHTSTVPGACPTFSIDDLLRVTREIKAAQVGPPCPPRAIDMTREEFSRFVTECEERGFLERGATALGCASLYQG